MKMKCAVCFLLIVASAASSHVTRQSSDNCTAIEGQLIPSDAAHIQSYGPWKEISFPSSSWLLAECNGVTVTLDMSACLARINGTGFDANNLDPLNEFWNDYRENASCWVDFTPTIPGFDQYSGFLPQCTSDAYPNIWNNTAFTTLVHFDDTINQLWCENFTDKNENVSQKRRDQDLVVPKDKAAARDIAPKLSPGMFLKRANGTVTTNSSASLCTNVPQRAFPPTESAGSACNWQPSDGGSGAERTMRAVTCQFLIGLAVIVIMGIWGLV
ncbi:hypothetical protein F5Y16DRAFT_374620 [Xylariaceae sp. FL0255]|nr:hypothetical protein F5Y16DRAFT_374620 [Xylariaceae sp. FL0255]